MIKTIFEILLALLLAISGKFYLELILKYILNWNKLIANQKNLTPTDGINLSIVIAARNEENTIKNILTDLINQSYPANKYEVIIVDDFSDDNTYTIINNFINDNGRNTFHLLKKEDKNTTPFGKKNAIIRGVAQAKGDLIIQTDADCSVGKEWLQTIANNYEEYKPKMMFGLVAYKDDKTIFEKLQHLEFLSLIASGAAAAYNKPIMCNGANLIYERKAYQEIQTLATKDIYASGDDVFLLLNFKKAFGNNSIKVIIDKEAIVYTKAKETLKEFCNQRIRWASKSKGYKDWDIIKTALIVFVFNISLLLSFIFSFYFNTILLLFSIFFILKIIIDIPILYNICMHTNRRDLLKYYLPLQIIYPIYLCFAAIAGFISKYNWKGRSITN